MKIVHAVGTRPNFVKMAPVIEALARRNGVSQLVVHTGQHYDSALSDDVLADLGLPEPDRFLGIGSGTHAEQTGRTLIEFERVLVEERPALTMVGGDVNATLACTLAAAKLGVPVAHVEAGLRSRDWSMPEEINRVLTDRLSALLFTHSPEAGVNLEAEGIDPGRVHLVGNTMIDSLRRFEPAARELAAWRTIGMSEREYVLVTLHRPSNVDRPDRLRAIMDELLRLGDHAPVVFPVHPRTRERLARACALPTGEGGRVRCIPPVGYLEFLSLETGAGAILTDSGGIQEEASVLGVPCFTLRPNTERPITLTHGTNELLGEDPAAIARVRVPARPPGAREIPLWDGRAGERVADVVTGARVPA